MALVATVAGMAGAAPASAHQSPAGCNNSALHLDLVRDHSVVRNGDTVQALHAVCAHAGGPLAEGTVVDGCVECPWHGSRFRLSDGLARQGPTVYDQPSYEIRGAEGGGYEVRRRAVS